MHPARLRIHPARPGDGSRAPGSQPSGRPAPRLSGDPGGDTGGRAPGHTRSFHFESTLRKFAKLVSRWLLRASREGAAHQPAVAAAPGGSRWLPRGPGRAAWEVGRARSGAGAALPERAGPHLGTQTPATGGCLGGALGRRPLCPRSLRPRPGRAPPPAPPRIVQPRGEPARRCAPGGSLWRRGGTAGAGAGARPTSPRSAPSASPGGGARDPGLERRRWGAVVGRYQRGGGLASRGPGGIPPRLNCSAETAAPVTARVDAGRGDGRVRRGPGRWPGLPSPPPPLHTAAVRGWGGGYTLGAQCWRLRRLAPTKRRRWNLVAS